MAGVQYHLHHLGKASHESDCYVFQLCVSHANGKIAASNSKHTIKLYNKDTLQYLGECKKKHQTEIRDICWSPTTPDTLVSCDGWGTVLLWDTRQMSGQNLPIHINAKELLFSLDLAGCGNILALGDNMDTVLYDLRRPDVELRRIEEFHTDEITKVRFHPTQQNILCTSSEDSLINVLDLTKEGDDDDLLMWVFNTSNPVNNLFFCGDQGECVVGLTTCEEVVFGSLESGEMLGSLNRQSDDSYVISCHYGPVFGKNEVVIFSGTKLEGVEGNMIMQTAIPQQYSPPVALFQGGHSDMIRSVVCLDEMRTLVTAGEDGNLCMWKTEPPTQADKERVMREHEASQASQAAKPKKKYKPY